MNKLFFLIIFASFTCHSQTPPTSSTNSTPHDKTISESVHSAISNARILYVEINELTQQLVSKIDLVDKTYPQKEGEGFLGGFKEVSADGGKTYIVINENVMKISACRNGVRMALDAYDALTNAPTAYDQAKLATEFSFQTDLFFLNSEESTRVMIRALRAAKQSEAANDMEDKYENLKNHSLSVRLRMYSLVKNYLETNK